LTNKFGYICSLEHGTTDAKPPAETSTTPDTSAATKTTQASATTRTQSMGKTSLKPLKAVLETIREQADFALRQLQKSEEERSTRWRCNDCKYTNHFTRPVPLEAASRCPRCKSISFQCVPEPDNPRAKIDHRRQSQQGWLELGLRLSRGFQRANDLDCRRASR
jgi:predicted Zn-ribbon and HTH transcriptional regulator